MTSHGVLQELLAQAWKNAITGDYHRQRINSERSLQASLWSKLNDLLSVEYRMFIEPRLKAKEGLVKPESRLPDIAICNAEEVVAFLEIKYLPRAKPKWQKDLKTFEWINRHKDQLKVQNVRYRGVVKDDRLYKISEGVLFVWAGVHASAGLDLRPYIEPSLSKRFFELHAETKHGEHPTVR